MAYDVKILPTAELEVEDIVEYLSGFGVQPARHFIEDYRRQLELLASGVIDYGYASCRRSRSWDTTPAASTPTSCCTTLRAMRSSLPTCFTKGRTTPDWCSNGF